MEIEEQINEEVAKLKLQAQENIIEVDFKGHAEQREREFIVRTTQAFIDNSTGLEMLNAISEGKAIADAGIEPESIAQVVALSIYALVREVIFMDFGDENG